MKSLGGTAWSRERHGRETMAQQEIRAVPRAACRTQLFAAEILRALIMVEAEGYHARILKRAGEKGFHDFQ